jgi:Rrf2 family transcriptional regulator, nitric oxide-sensitive transcriptional repressor
MRLSLQTDYALRTLMFLASYRGQDRPKIADVARFFRISVAHVAKVVNQLARLGFLRSVRGAGGGIELGRPVKDIRLGEVVVAFEGNMHLLECVGRDNVCIVEKHCKLKNVLAEAERRQLDYLNNVRLSDVIPV